MSKNKKQIEKTNKIEKVDFFENPKTHFLMIGLIVLVITVLFFHVGYKNLVPRAHDTEQWRWASQELIEHNKDNKDRALWADNMFAGMPSYLLSFPAKYPFFHNIPHYFNSIVNWRVIYLIFGAVGMYILLIYFKMSPLIALFSALAFALSPHFIGLLEIGHNTKFRTIMYLPWILLAFDDLKNNKRILSLGLFSVFLIDQLRINHFQISYYTFLMLFIYWLTFLIKSLKEKTLKTYIEFTALAILGLLITILAVSNPYLSTYEYSHYTIRGGASGLTSDYATSWSFGITEVFSFFVPYVFGGILYHYWGAMPFTQTFHYMGIIVIYLAIMASIFYYKKTTIKALIITSIFALLISFGKHLPFLSNLLLSYLPLFNKFRVPAMILVLVQFSIPILAAYGLKLFIEKSKIKDHIFNKSVVVSLVLAIGLLVLFFQGEKVFSDLALSNPDHREMARYTTGQLAQLKSERLTLLIDSGIRSFGILVGGIILLFLLVKGVIKKNIVLVLLIGLTVFDLTFINDNHLKINSLVEETSVLNEFQTNNVDTFLLNDDDLFRIYPVEDFGNARWSYYHQSIGGYHGAKLSRYQDILDNNLNFRLRAGIPINWNIVNMLNVKYLIFNSHYDLQNDDIERAMIDGDTRHAIYRNNGALPRAWFVENQELIVDKNWMTIRLNDPSFDPRNTVLVEKVVPEFSYHEDSTIDLIERSKHHKKWKTTNENDSFMVISEIYYPAGWKVFVNGKETEIYPANYILRGVIIPAGENTVEMRFQPTSYKISIMLSAIGLLLSLGLTILGAILYYNSNYGKGVVYKIES